MLFEPNNMNAIHLGNYQEYFILYMDNELDENQVKMVDAFLEAHPDLRDEFDILVSTKLPIEQFTIDKKELLAENMKLSAVDEELLLYIDNELPADKKKTVELELAANKNYQLQHRLLLQARLDPSEKIAYPDKKELYRRTEKIISMKVWMRVAAAVVVIAVGGIVYFKNPPVTQPSTDQALTGTTAPPQKTGIVNTTQPGLAGTTSANPVNNTEASGKVDEVAKTKITVTPVERESNEVAPVIAYIPQGTNEAETSERPKVSTIQMEGRDNTIDLASKDILNTGAVTKINPERTTIIDSPEELAESNNRKGSVKGFLRKATRMIEKRTGIDPTNGDGDLLIGAVAINLK